MNTHHSHDGYVPDPFWSVNDCMARSDSAHDARVANEIRILREQQENLYYRVDAHLLTSPDGTNSSKFIPQTDKRHPFYEPDRMGMSTKTDILAKMLYTQEANLHGNNSYTPTTAIDSLREMVALFVFFAFFVTFAFLVCVGLVKLLF